MQRRLKLLPLACRQANGSNLRSKRKDPPCADNISVS